MSDFVGIGQSLTLFYFTCDIPARTRVVIPEVIIN